jgi:hypothetical protein
MGCHFAMLLYSVEVIERIEHPSVLLRLSLDVDHCVVAALVDMSLSHSKLQRVRPLQQQNNDLLIWDRNRPQKGALVVLFNRIFQKKIKSKRLRRVSEFAVVLLKLFSTLDFKFLQSKMLARIIATTRRGALNIKKTVVQPVVALYSTSSKTWGPANDGDLTLTVASNNVSVSSNK